MTQKVCFLLRIDPTQIETYVERHRSIWPEMLTALTECGYRNYSMFVDPSGLLVGYLETDDFAAASSRMASTDVQRAWSAYMDHLFLPVDRLRPIGVVTPLLHAFDLESATAAVSSA
ncbi:L-rhamnose mutarotase [Microbacterium aurum]